MKESEGVKVRTRSDNVELFAVENRRTPAVVASKPIQKMVEKVVVPSYSGTNNTNVVLSGGSSMLRNSLIGLQAELLRIEAEKEQSLVDDERILSEKVITMPYSRLRWPHHHHNARRPCWFPSTSASCHYWKLEPVLRMSYRCAESC